MEWVGLIMWLMVGGLALGVAVGGSLSYLSLGVQSLFVFGGLVFCVLYPALETGAWPAWVSAGMALGATLATLVGVAGLTSDRPGPMATLQTAEDLSAVLAGFEVPLLLATGFVMTLAAVGVTTVG